MAAYRFCRTDDIGLLVEALNRCRAPGFPGEPLMTPAAFKRSIRDLQVWCSSCMVAFSGSDPVGVLIGAKRSAATLVHEIAVHPDHRRQGHGRHLLASLGSKLAILGPPRIVAEVPETLAPACELLSASGYVQEALLTDYVWQDEENNAREVGGMSADHAGRFVIPVTVDDLAANGLLGEPHPPVCWERSVETLTARKEDIAGLAVASDERIEAYVLYAPGGVGPAEIVSLRTFIEDGGARLKQLLSRLGMGTFRFPKVHPAGAAGISSTQRLFDRAQGPLEHRRRARARSGSDHRSRVAAENHVGELSYRCVTNGWQSNDQESAIPIGWSTTQRSSRRPRELHAVTRFTQNRPKRIGNVFVAALPACACPTAA
jgi:GNAT superfamily N-acetyltransferase